jgi:fructose-bisphosphate aldolase, class II
VVRVSGISLLNHASENNYILPAFNVSSENMAQSILDGAKLAQSPIFLQTNQINIQSFRNIKQAGKEINDLVQQHPLPVAIHLDHANSLADVQEARSSHYSSFMLDYSTLPLEENINNITIIRNTVNLSTDGLEGELGIIGGQSELIGNATYTESLYTDPNEASYFVQKTQVDSLAIAIGAKHGIAGKINYTLLNKIQMNVNKPLVIHGGSGINKQSFSKLNQHGIKKINFGTALHNIFYKNNNTEKFSLENNKKDLTEYVRLICNDLNSKNQYTSY